MNATQAENLRILIHHMETNVTRDLYMGCYFFGDGPCGTPACALGEATAIPALIRAGLRITETGYCIVGEGYVFGLTCAEDARLFNTTFRGRVEVTPQEWAAEARKVLAENGYTMGAPKPDAFAAFMAKVREPVAVEA